jgi:catechol 2,3-dioxygenase-like lactoylglutathione lyase family enzyme
MFAKLNHLAIISEHYERSADFYEAVFGLRTDQARPASAAMKNGARTQYALTLGDGYLGLNINPRRAGRPARLEHFGIQVEDADTAFARMKKYPEVKWLKRPSDRPFAAVTSHDPDGNVFDISQKTSGNRRGLYAEEHAVNERRVDHFALRTMRPDYVAQFYREVFELEPRNKAEGDKNHYLSDGQVTLVVMPWDITDYDGTGIIPATMDHIGFAVEDLDRFKAHMAAVTGGNPYLAPMPVSTGPEGEARLALDRRSCPLCDHHFTDIDGVMLSARAA